MIVNVDQIAWIEQRPDTLVVLANGEKLLVRETPETLVRRATAYKRAALAERPSPIELDAGDASDVWDAGQDAGSQSE